MRVLFATGFALLMSVGAQANTWLDWWQTADQQGEHALDAGRPAQAARLFRDPRRRAYAQLRSGAYADAAKQLEPFKDPDSLYNRGNALARAKDLKGALEAYDDALKQSIPDAALRRDAQHNRDLVARQLQRSSSSSGSQQPPSSQSPKNSSQNPSSQGPSPQDGSSDQSKQASSDSGSGSDSSSGKEDNSNADARSSSNAANAATSRPKPTGAQGSSSSGEEQARRSANDKEQQASAGPGGQPQPSANATTGNSQARGAVRDQEQLRRETQRAAEQAANSTRAGNAKDANQATAGENTGAIPGDSKLAQSNAPPPSEQSIALEQWLRQIPDDPAGLLRRKFLIEHWLKTQEARP